MTAKLLPCPFCGSEPEHDVFGYYHEGNEARLIHCNNSDCKVKPSIYLEQSDDQFDMIEAWNERH